MPDALAWARGGEYRPMNEWLNPVVEAHQRYFGKVADPVVWDVGSRDGDDGVELGERIYTGDKSRFWENATIVCLEPNPDQALVIMERHPKMSEILEVAASNFVGTAPFMVYHGDEGAVGSSSLNLDWKEDDLEGHQIFVAVDRLENLIGDEVIDIMKIDVEGSGLQALEGLGDKLNQVRVLHIETEDWTGSDEKAKKYLTDRGWKLYDERQQWSGMPDLTWVNANPVGRKSV